MALKPALALTAPANGDVEMPVDVHRCPTGNFVNVCDTSVGSFVQMFR
jgi:hypothetical protein